DDASLATAVQRACLRRGLIVDLSGGQAGVVRLLPPLTITDEQAEAVLDRLTDAIASVAATADERHSVRPVPERAGGPGDPPGG
ncbi:aspartate aminotransferase family protein, partial [Streptomyces scabiei]|nr:aspartate aminotransferase family protein [Streptomyces scabiei]